MKVLWRIAAAVVVVGVLFASETQAWGVLDPDSIARIAQAQLHPARLQQVLLPSSSPPRQVNNDASNSFQAIPQLKFNSASGDDKTHKRKKQARHGNSQSPIFGLIKVTLASIAEVVVLSAVGYILARKGILDKRTQTKINKLNVSFFTPALLFSKVAFTLNPGRLAELIVVPAGFVLITLTSTVAAFVLAWMANLSRSQRNFSIACAITPNSNSLPVALMQSLVLTVPQLHWEEEGEAEDTPDGMLGRALTYLVLFSTLGMFLRWSVASHLLSTMEENDDAAETDNGLEHGEGVPTGRLIDHDSSADTTYTPQINVRRSTQDGGGVEPIAPATLTAETMPEGPAGKRSNSKGRRKGPPNWTRSFPNSPRDSDPEDDSEEGDARHETTSTTNRMTTSLQKIYQVGIKKPFIAVTNFMTMPLYAAVISLVVALIPPLQSTIAKVEPAVSALETAGACSIPLTMVVLGAYFHQTAEAAPTTNNTTTTTTTTTTTQADTDDAREIRNRESNSSPSSASTLVGHGDSRKRDSMPWKQGSNGVPSHHSRSVSGSGGDDGGANNEGGGVVEDHTNSKRQRWSIFSSSRESTTSPAERKEKRRLQMERRTVMIAISSRMLLTPLLLLPFLAWVAIATRGNVMDDPVFLTCACLLVGSPPALTLAQITSQSAKGSNNSFERLLSRTIFVSYAILAAPTTVVLVLVALVIASND